ncbi:hypothetical protein CDAR_53731 [Caerostris darwini]|uniref:Maturase K n=1 Tax=Caerostris darwini TaxID=1538125 RepID=A0AAV4VSK1_9ARAC|nr:hypothetical protein CDAR_53731 [Caerostris darwini]
MRVWDLSEVVWICFKSTSHFLQNAKKKKERSVNSLHQRTFEFFTIVSLDVLRRRRYGYSEGKLSFHFTTRNRRFMTSWKDHMTRYDSLYLPVP